MTPLAGEFVTSVSTGGVVPADGLPAIVLVGRSNVGKSSLINTLVRKRVARSGGKPGTTRLINLYRIATPSSNIRPFLLVDLPGYGYARGGTKARQSFEILTDSFFKQVTVGVPGPATGQIQLAGVSLVVDVRHPGLESDREAFAWISRQRYPVVVVATKADRISRSTRTRMTKRHLEALHQSDVSDSELPLLVTVSTKTGENMSLLWSELKRLLRLL
jgi:GTP-binding protein